MTTIFAKTALHTTIVSAMLLLGCGGRAVQLDERPSPDASTDAHQVVDAGLDVNVPDTPLDAPLETATDQHAPDPSCHGCICKNWLKNDVSTYPAIFFYPEFNPSGACVLEGCPDGEVCCATSCVDPSVCEYTGTTPHYEGCGALHDIHDPPPAPETDCCWDYGYTACVAPELCPSEGVLQQGQFDPQTNGKIESCLQYWGCVDDPG